jgi:hypothetical protein
MKKIVDDITKALEWGGYEVFPVVEDKIINKMVEITAKKHGIWEEDNEK